MIWSETVASVLRQDRSETKKKSVLILQAVVLVLVLQFCFVMHDLATLVVIIILKDTEQLFKYYL